MQKASELFSTNQVAKLLNRSQLCIRWHATHNVEAIEMGPTGSDGRRGRLFFTKDMIRDIALLHLRLKSSEDLIEVLQRIDDAVP